jgi:hypothetical protein
MAYDPAPIESLGLLVFLVIGAAVPYIFILRAHSFSWRAWYKQPSTYKPPLFIPELYSTVYLLIFITFSLGTWIGWRETLRVDSGSVLDPLDTKVPTGGDVFKMNLFYILTMASAALFGEIVFEVGLRQGFFGLALINELTTVAMAATTTTYAWKVTTTAGITCLVPTCLLFYKIAMAALYWLFGVSKVEGHFAHPVEYLMATVGSVQNLARETSNLVNNALYAGTSPLRPEPQPVQVYIPPEVYAAAPLSRNIPHPGTPDNSKFITAKLS